MTQAHKALAQLRRPGLLIRAARHGLGDYNRRRDLKRIFGQVPDGGADRALTRLIEVEAELDAERRAASAAYSPRRHVELLIAIMGEAKALTTPQLVHP